MPDEAGAITQALRSVEAFCKRTTNESLEVCRLRDIGVRRGFKLIATITAAGNTYEWPGKIDELIDETTARIRWAQDENVEFAGEADVQFVREHKLYLEWVEWEEADETPDPADRLENASLESALKAQIDSFMFVTGTSVVLTDDDLDEVRSELHLDSWVLVDGTAWVLAPPLLHDKSTPAPVPWRKAEDDDHERPYKLSKKIDTSTNFLYATSKLLVAATFGGGIVWSKVWPYVEEHAAKLLLLVLGIFVLIIARNVIEKNRQVLADGGAQQPAMPAGAAPAPAQRPPKSPGRGARRR
tara:strand:- start:264 stop:1160 length:897 start_codon:yes stop_codon:yes gene_type:complete